MSTYIKQKELLQKIEYFLNDRRGFHVDSLDDDIRQIFLDDLFNEILKIYPEP